MSQPTKLLVPLVLVAAAAGGAYYFLNQSSPTPVVAPPGPTQQPERPAPVEPKVEPVQAAPAQTPQQPERTVASGPGDDPHSDAPQGVRGRILLPNGTPASDYRVILVESASNDPLQVFLKNRTGQLSPPLASSHTDADGAFSLGVLKPGNAVDLRVVGDEYPELHRNGIRVRAEDWFDAGELRLEQGLVVQGRVVETWSKVPVAGAVVFLASSHQSHAMVATPGRERGASAETDQSGFFRFENAPRQGLVNLVVEAPGYAVGQLLNQQLKQDGLNEFSIEIGRGEAITGVVVDHAGTRISGAKLQAIGLSSKTPQTEMVYSDGNGEFRFPSLRSGPYRLNVTSDRFANTEIPLVLTGEDVKVVMQKRGTVLLQVLSADQRPLKAYRISLKRSFPNNPTSIGNVMDYPDRSINPGDYPAEFKGQFARIEGLPAGDYRFQIVERDHAKTLSPAFHIEEGGDPVQVVAVMTLGATLTGTVIDTNGKPVPGAVVQTDMNAGIAANTGILDMFRPMIPEKHTARQERTDAQGRFRIARLSFADYMIRVSHQDFCEGTAINLKLEQEGQVVDAGVIQLERGAVVEGITRVDGQPMGQIKVVVSVPMNQAAIPQAQPGQPNPALQPGQQDLVMFSANVLSDGDGRFRLLKRVPPGRYKVTAARHQAENPFGALLDMKQSEQELVIAPGQEHAELSFNLAGR